MSRTESTHKPVVDWVTVVAIAAVTISLTIGLHEGVHALTCLVVGGDLQEFSALHVSCESISIEQEKVISGASAIYNLIAGTILWMIVRQSSKLNSRFWFFLWLSMLMNWLNGAGYFMFSGIANVGDMAVVIRAWEPSWLWRATMAIVGSVIFMFFVWLALREFGKMIGGEPDEQIKRANKLSILSYITSFVVVLIAGLFNPYGFFSLPVIAGLLAVLGGLSPLLWMMQWFTAKSFVKLDKEPLEIYRSWQ